MDRPQETATKTSNVDETKTKNQNNASHDQQIKSTSLNPFHTLVDSGEFDDYLRGACFGRFLRVVLLGLPAGSTLLGCSVRYM